MNARTTRRGTPAAVIWGGFGVLAWATFTVLTGGGSAHADEQNEGPLDGLTSLVSNTVSAVTAPVAPIVTQVVAPIVTKVVAPVQQALPAVVTAVTQPIAQTPVVGPATSPVVHAVTETATSIVTPVTGILTGSPVSQLTDPILQTVASVPVVGGLATDLGVLSAVGDIVRVVDDTTALLGNVTNGTVSPVLEALDPTTPGPGQGSGGITEPPAHPSTTVRSDDPVASEPAVSTSVGTFSAAGPPLSPSFPTADSATLAGDDGTPVPTGLPSGSPPGAPVPASSSAGSGAGSSTSHARLSDVDSSPLLTGERTSGASDDVLPSSPVADTDVSPD